MSTSSINTTKVKDCLIVTIGDDLSDGSFEKTKETVLDHIHQDGCLKLVFELSMLKYMDTIEFDELREMAETAAMLGAETVFSGINPGIIFHLVMRDAKIDGVTAVLDLNEALNRLGIVNAVG